MLRLFPAGIIHHLISPVFIKRKLLSLSRSQIKLGGKGHEMQMHKGLQ
jgi:hypothetical protein